MVRGHSRVARSDRARGENKGDAKNESTSADMNDLSCLLPCPSSESKHEVVKKYMYSPRFPVAKMETNFEPCSSPCLPNIGGFGCCQRYLFWKCDTRAQSDLPAPQEPQLAEAGDWAADFNQLQIACYEGHMRACDSLWKSNRVLTDTFLYDFGRSCGARVDRRQISRSGLDCTEAFPGHE